LRFGSTHKVGITANGVQPSKKAHRGPTADWNGVFKAEEKWSARENMV
jgi:hypothetical protein